MRQGRNKKSSPAELATTLIRVRRETLARLRAALTRLIEAVECGNRPDPGSVAGQINPAALPISMDTLISLMLDEREAHQQRAADQRARRRASRVDVSDPPGPA